MIVFQDRNGLGRRDAAEVYFAFCTTTPQPSSIDRVSYLYGMQSFCCDQLQTELRAAADALAGTPLPAPHCRGSIREPIVK